MLNSDTVERKCTEMKERLAKRARADIKRMEQREAELIRIRGRRELEDEERRELGRLQQHKSRHDWYGYRSEMYRRWIFNRLWNKLYNIEVVTGAIARPEVQQEAYAIAMQGKENAKRWIREFDKWWGDGTGDKSPNAWRLVQYIEVG